MQTVTLSTKYQVVIPKAVRERLALAPGEQFQVFAHAERIELVLVRPMRRMRGFLPTIDTSVDREADRV